MPGRLRYVGRGLIVEVATAALVSPREVVDAYNELLAERERQAAAARPGNQAKTSKRKSK